jgi:hypothetical protein
MRPLRAPGLSEIWFSLFLFDAHQVAHLVDHAAHLGRIHELTGAMALVQLQPDQRRALVFRAADVAAGLGDLDGLALGHCPAP